MRTIMATLLASSLMVSSTFAATQSFAPLPAGKPAGVKEASFLGPNTLLVLIGLGIAIGGLALAISSPGGNGITSGTVGTTSTSSTSTTSTSTSTSTGTHP
jgi:hypothetical protein